MSHVYEPLPASSRVKVRLVDVVGEDTADGDILGRASRSDRHEDQQQGRCSTTFAEKGDGSIWQY